MEGLQWFALGVLVMLTINGLVYVHMTSKTKWYVLPLMLFSVIFILFGIAWCISSYLEGYPQSGALGLSLFSGPGVIGAIFIWRYFIAPEYKAQGRT